MKKILSLLLIVLMAASCELTKMPQGSISSEGALTSVDDALKFRTDMYLDIRDYLSSGYPIYIQELMSDSFHASSMFGNRDGEYHTWSMVSTMGYVESIWSNSYYNVTLANYLEAGIAKLMENPELSVDDKAQLEVILGEAAFLKAFSMFKCIQLYCKPYNASSAATDLGLMLINEPVTDPGNITSYVGRSSLADTYKYIEDNLEVAATKLASVAGAEGSIYITKDAVTAMKARVALEKGDFATAITNATALIDGGKYPLVDNIEDLEGLWLKDSGKECIVQYWAGYTEGSLPNSNSRGYIGYNASGIFVPDYIPEQWVVDTYNEYPEDIRFKSWFKQTDVTYGAVTGNVCVCFKFKGNDEFDKAGTGYSEISRVKAFRIAEQYLIAAEAYARRGQAGDADKACEYLNVLRAKRIPDYAEKTYTGETLLEEVKKERAKELFGEGFRLNDLKRWGKGLTRSNAQDINIITMAGSTSYELLNIPASDYRWLWPIPQAEIDANPQIKDQQNDGY